MNIDMTPLLEALMALIAALIAGKLLPWLNAKLGSERMRQLDAAYEIAVYAAEEIYRAGYGAQKLSFACEYLKKRGYAVDMERLKAAVNKMRAESQAAKPETIASEPNA